MIAHRALALGLVVALSGSGCLTLMEKWKPGTTDPQAIGMAMIYGNTALAIGGNHATSELGVVDSLPLWWLGIFCADMGLFLATHLAPLKH